MKTFKGILIAVLAAGFVIGLSACATTMHPNKPGAIIKSEIDYQVDGVAFKGYMAYPQGKKIYRAC